MMRRLLLTNDDGIDAPGLAALEEACAGLADELIVVAPHEPNSQVGHRVTTHEPIALTEQVAERRFAVHGTPADCVRVALKALLHDTPPDFVVSGINYGGNLGLHDFYISGTVAAAREAAFHGFPAAAISNYHHGEFPFHWDTAARRARSTLQALLTGEPPLADGELWNINLPHVAPDAREPELRHCRLERAPLEVAYERSSNEEGHHFRYTGRYQSRGHDGTSDVAVCFGGDIAVTRLSL